MNVDAWNDDGNPESRSEKAANLARECLREQGEDLAQWDILEGHQPQIPLCVPYNKGPANPASLQQYILAVRPQQSNEALLVLSKHDYHKTNLDTLPPTSATIINREQILAEWRSFAGKLQMNYPYRERGPYDSTLQTANAFRQTLEEALGYDMLPRLQIKLGKKPPESASFLEAIRKLFGKK